jgi:hypothetical protein
VHNHADADADEHAEANTDRYVNEHSNTHADGHDDGDSEQHDSDGDANSVCPPSPADRPTLATHHVEARKDRMRRSSGEPA